MSGPMGYYPNQYNAPMNGMGGNMRPPYGAPNGMPGGMSGGYGMRPPMYQNQYYSNGYGNQYGNYGMPMMQQPQPPMYPGPGRGMGGRGRGGPSPTGRLVCSPSAPHQQVCHACTSCYTQVTPDCDSVHSCYCIYGAQIGGLMQMQVHCCNVSINSGQLSCSDAIK